MMLGSKGILTPLIPNCYVLCTLAILMKKMRNFLTLAAAAALTANPDKDSVTAIFAAWDEPAISAAKALAEAGRDDNVTGLPVHVYKDPDLLPALAITSSVFLAEGIIPDYPSFIHVLAEKGGCTVLEPDPDAVKAYEPVYKKYKTIYPMIHEFYHEV